VLAAKSYAKGWLPVDFVSCLPFGYIPYVLGEGEGGAGNKATRMLRMFRLLKLLRLVRIKRILDRWEEEMYGARALKIGKIVFLMAGAAHWVACTWFFVGAPTLTADGNSTVPYIMPNGDPTEGWVLRRYNSVEIADSISMWEKYRDSLFWSTMSVIMIDAAEVGMTPETYAEKLIYVISFIIGAFLVSMIIGQISDMIAHANPGDAAKADTIGLVHAFLHERRVGASLTKRVRAHFNQLYSNRGTTEDMQGFFDHLPRALALELAGAVGFIDDIQANRRSVVYKVPFCRNLSADDMIRLCCKMKHCAYEPPQVYLDGSLDRTRFIMREGERGAEMWVMLEGKVRVETTSGGGETVDLGTLGVSEFFGESAVLAEESPGVPLKRLRSVYAITQLVQTIALTYRDLCELRQESRTIDEAVEREAMGFKQVRAACGLSAARLRHRVL
jgi:CRP-like cAMP-binding protein